MPQMTWHVPLNPEAHTTPTPWAMEQSDSFVHHAHQKVGGEMKAHKITKTEPKHAFQNQHTPHYTHLKQSVTSVPAFVALEFLAFGLG